MPQCSGCSSSRTAVVIKLRRKPACTLLPHADHVASRAAVPHRTHECSQSARPADSASLSRRFAPWPHRGIIMMPATFTCKFTLRLRLEGTRIPPQLSLPRLRLWPPTTTPTTTPRRQSRWMPSRYPGRENTAGSSPPPRAGWPRGWPKCAPAAALARAAP